LAIITISRGTYSGGKALAEALGRQLGYRLLSREELLARAAQRFGIPPEDLESALLMRPRFLESRSKKLHYIYCVQAALADDVRRDGVVYHGQAGHLLLKDIRHHVRLKVVASLAMRVKAATEGGNDTDPLRYVQKLDTERDKWVRWVYGVDRTDPATYDLVFNLEQVSIPTACAVVSRLVHSRFQTTPASQAALEDLAFASELRAQIGLDRHIVDDRIEIDARAGVVTLKGTVRSLVDADRLREFVGCTDGVKEVQSQLSVRW
jgi:cytidylate kinase